jgi:hypothetical protein
MMAVVIDKALDWKEKTMRAKWLWTTWAFLAVATVIALEVLFITFMVLYIVPKFQKLMHDGIVDPAIFEEQSITWMPRFLNDLQYLTNHYTTWITLGALLLWGLFEWRVKNEYKPFIRVSVFGMVASTLMVVIILQAGSMLVSFCLAAPPMAQMATPYAQKQVAVLESAVAAFEENKTKKQWFRMEEQLFLASMALKRLSVGPALSSLTIANEPWKLEDLWASLRAAESDMIPVHQAIRDNNEAQLEATWAKYRKSVEPIREAAKSARR